MKSAAINSRWFALNPDRRMDAAYWLAVCDQLAAAGVDRATATDDQVRVAMAATEAAIHGAEAKAAAVSSLAAQLIREAAEIRRSNIKPSSRPKRA